MYSKVIQSSHLGLSCADPGIPSNGKRYGSVFTNGHNVHFQCEQGYSLVGSSIRTCLPTGNWSGTETRCVGMSEDCYCNV